MNTSGTQKKIVFIIGTRPEIIKFAPLLLKLKRESKFRVRICFTGQHKELLDDTAAYFEINPDVHLSLMSADQTLSKFVSIALVAIEKVLIEELPDLVFVQGDTSTVLAGALASFYQKVPVAHLEAGLRSHDLYNPFPEEMNRVQTSKLACFHFTPTKTAVLNLSAEGITKNVYNVGNSVIDALKLCLEKIKQEGDFKYKEKFKKLDFTRKCILVTMHRRENFGRPMDDILHALKIFANGYPEVQMVIPVHPNPNVKSKITDALREIKNVFLYAPFTYPEMVYMMNKSFFIVTDSGGVQEEAPTLKKPVLVLRNTTERKESVEAGLAALVGTNKDKIIGYMTRLMEDSEYYSGFMAVENPYGDGSTSDKIIDILKQELCDKR